MRKEQKALLEQITHEWTQDGSLATVFGEDELDRNEPEFTDRDGEREKLHRLALRYCYDIARLKMTDMQDEFMRDMVERATTMYSLTPAQARGVMNVLRAGLYCNRARFQTTLENTRQRKLDNGHYESCIVCGRRIKNAEMVARNIGWTCYKRVMGF